MLPFGPADLVVGADRRRLAMFLDVFHDAATGFGGSDASVDG